MGMTTFRCNVKSTEGLRVEGESRGLRVLFDEPIELGGTNEGMNPIEMLLNSLGACQVITAKVHAPKFNVKLDDMWVEVEGDLDIDGFKGVPGVKSGLQEIRFIMHITSDSEEENVRNLIEEVERLCPVGASLKDSVYLRETAIVFENARLQKTLTT